MSKAKYNFALRMHFHLLFRSLVREPFPKDQWVNEQSPTSPKSEI